ncbi:HAMP domain-containing histidine kinase [Actinomadura barringtoniae]|uniref:histidine kinase n=1 Tax=Actinomadura barringtoniae TaxID=1427535 RepID=A0A939T798_9ACTN|nr:HAMP domain-containing sensor histidine kinase [Actinomadura barringtoniae]MBO2452873.1 HAMP domain-containing histidine kinase [Actinomadura barringtoniae]
MRRGEPLPVWGRLPIRARLAVLAAAAVAVAVAGAALVAYAVVDRTLHNELDRSLQRQSAQLKREIQTRDWAQTGTCEWRLSPCAQIVQPDGTADQKAGLPITPRMVAVAGGRAEAFFTESTALGLPIRIYTMPIRLPDGSNAALEVGVRSDGVDRSLRQAGLALLLTAIVGVGVAALLGYLVARGAMRPVARLTRASERIAATRDPGVRMNVTGRDELARLATSFNAMLGALDESITAQRRLVADASHELRTPLTALRSDIELLDRLPPERRERVMARLRGQLAGLGDLVGDLIELARGDEPADPVEDVRLDRLVEHCVEQARTRWPAVTFTIDVAGGPADRHEPAVVPGMPRRLTRAVANLLDNAAKFGGTSGPVEVGLAPTPPDGWRLSVRDHGPGIDPADLPYVFDRFYRSTGARGLPGSGLGLAIVAQVAREHHAEVRAVRPDGGGTLISLDLSPGLSS